MTTAIIVPARLGSTRLQGKLLRPVAGRPVILVTADRIRAVAPDYPLHFAVDSEELATLLADAGYDAIMTDPALPCGTDRVAAANRKVGASRVINVQGDVPYVSTGQIAQLVELLDGGTGMATLGAPLRDEATYRDPNHVKLVWDEDGNAIFFSRAAIPCFRDTGFDPAGAEACRLLLHMGLYAYTAAFLEQFAAWTPGPLEDAEKLEMLRALEHGARIAVGENHDPYYEVDTAEQAAELEALLEARKA
jgi:3-deoxy-manno-octulosonate cytidylyltransferase (CMP-KDO synthetase)